MADRTLTTSELLDQDTALMVVGFVPAMLWLLWLVVAGAWNDWLEGRNG
jgi:hypothetical protein